MRAAAVLVALLPAAAAFCGPTPASRRFHTFLLPSAATCAGALRELPAVILPGDQALAPGERRTLVFADKSEKRALKQVMKGGAQGKAGKVGRLAVVHFDEAALAARRMELAPIGCEVEVVSREKLVSVEPGQSADPSRSVRVEVEGVNSLRVEPRPIQLEPFVRVRAQHVTSPPDSSL